MNGSSSVKLVSSFRNYFQWYSIVSCPVSFDLVSTLLFFISTKFERTTLKQGPQITRYLWFVYLLTNCSFESVISSSAYTAFHSRIINELEVAWRKLSWPNETLTNICLETLRKTIFNLSHESVCLGWDLNLGSTEYEARELPNWLQSLVLVELYTKCMGYVDQRERTAHSIPLVAASPWLSHYKHLHCILSWHLPWETQKTIPNQSW